MSEGGSVAGRVIRVRERMRAAQARRPVEWGERLVQLVAATKGVSIERMQEAVNAGVDAIGENRVQELVHKLSRWRPTVPCHFIGRLQRNKVRPALEWCEMIQSVDSLPLAEAIHHRQLSLAPSAAGDGPVRGRRILIQVNVAGESSKGGFAPDQLESALVCMARWRGLAIEGLMTIPPATPEPESARPYFRQLRQLAERAERWRIEGVSMTTLSMGMSHDFEVAIEEGATMIRIGTALFGPRRLESAAEGR